MASEISKELIAWFKPSTADISEYLEDTVQYVLDSPFEHWKNLAVCWHTKDKEWKKTKSAILDKLNDQRRIVLLQELLKSRGSEACGTVAILVSQSKRAAIPKHLLERLEFASRATGRNFQCCGNTVRLHARHAALGWISLMTHNTSLNLIRYVGASRLVGGRLILRWTS